RRARAKYTPGSQGHRLDGPGLPVVDLVAAPDEAPLRGDRGKVDGLGKRRHIACAGRAIVCVDPRTRVVDAMLIVDDDPAVGRDAAAEAAGGELGSVGREAHALGCAGHPVVQEDVLALVGIVAIGIARDQVAGEAHEDDEPPVGRDVGRPVAVEVALGAVGSDAHPLRGARRPVVDEDVAVGVRVARHEVVGPAEERDESSDATLTRSVVPVVQSWTKASTTPFVSSVTRFVAALVNATTWPSSEIPEGALSPSPPRMPSAAMLISLTVSAQ